MIQGQTCQTEGCCIASDKYKFESPTETNKPDAQFPSTTHNVIDFFVRFPLFIYLFTQEVLFHIMGQPKRPSWNLCTSATVSVLRGLSYAYKDSSLLLWRFIMGSTKGNSQRNGFYSSPFTAKRLGVKGILAECDSLEDGERIINAEWMIHQEKEDTDDKVILYVHGGGFCLKDWNAAVQIPTNLVKYTHKNVFSVNYRLAPETRFPGALYDVVQAYFHLIEDYNVESKDIVLVGDSAGGCLTMALLIYLRDHKYPLPDCSVHISPWLDISYDHDSWSKSSFVDYMPAKPHKDTMNPALLYVSPSRYHQVKYHPYVSPLYAENYNDLPPILIQSGDAEVMKDEIHCFMYKHGSCNTVIKHEEYQDMVHDFQSFGFPQSHLAFENIQHWFQHKTRAE